jgi:hypothetical protein
MQEEGFLFVLKHLRTRAGGFDSFRDHSYTLSTAGGIKLPTVNAFFEIKHDPIGIGSS